MSPFPRKVYAPLEPYAPDRRPVEVDLSDNTNRWGTHPAALDLIRNAPVEALTRYPSVYADAFRAAVAARFGVPPESVATGCGSDDLLDSTFRAAGEPGERIAYATPTFSMVETFTRMNGMEPVALPWLPGVPPEPEALLASRPALVYVCRPNNPTGEVVPRSWVERLLEAGGEGGPVVLLDEAYADFHGEGFLELAPTTSRLIVVRTLSKSYGLAGLRVAFAVGAPGVIREVEISRGPYKVNRLAEMAAVVALEDREGWVPPILDEVRRNRGWLEARLEERGFRPLPSGANFLLLPVPDARSTVASLRERGVAVRPFPDLPGVGDGVRVSIGPRHELDRFLEALDDLPRETGTDPLKDEP
jgi:histidinol-phosphate aminotransferase